MITRKALIIYCDNTKSGKLPGPSKDYEIVSNFMLSSLGGDWNENEVHPLQNPTVKEVKNAVKFLLADANYTFIMFSGHGCINIENGMQLLEVADGDIPIIDLKTTADRQTIIIDACRGYERIEDSIQKVYESTEFFSMLPSTRRLFDEAVLNAEKGASILYSASPNESSEDDDSGAPYISSVIQACKNWSNNNNIDNVFTIKEAHIAGTDYMYQHFFTNQNPVMNKSKRNRYFPLAVKYTIL